MAGRRSRSKGAAGERELAAKLRELLGENIRRGWQARDGTDQADLEGLPIWPECKRQKRPNIMAALRQACEDTDGRVPVAMVRADRGGWVAALRLEDWAPMLKAWLAQLAWEKGPHHLRTCGTQFRGCAPDCPLMAQWEAEEAVGSDETP